MRSYINHKTRGVALLITILLMSLILFLLLYFLGFSVTESKISKNQSLSVKTYYLAEGGVNEMVWRLKNDATYENSFETNPSWTASFSRANPFGPNSGSYDVTITNTSNAHGQIVSTGKINLGGGKTTQRVIKTYVYKALGQTSIGNSAGYADGNINISASRVNFYNGSAHSNNVFDVNNSSAIFVDSDLEAAGNYIQSWTASATILGVIHAANYPPAGATIAMPAIDFNSAATSSLKNRATVIYTENQFENLLKNNQNLTLPGPITYVTGEVEIEGARSLIINGLLVIEDELEVGESQCWQGKCGRNNITVNHASGTPAGILVQKTIDFDSWTGNVNLNGVVYAVDQLNILNLPAGLSSFNAVGGLVSRKLTITSSWQPVNITHNNDILAEVFSATEYSPTVLVEHWEEEY